MAGIGLVTLQLACSGSCLFGPPCDPDEFVDECTTERSYQRCEYNTWAQAHHTYTVTCSASERCLVADDTKTTCALYPVETCTLENARRCVDTELHACGGPTATLGGLELWHVDDTCETDETCLQDGDRAGCVDLPVEPCTFAEKRYRCEDGGPQECRGLPGVGPLETEPHFWTPILEPCDSDEACVSDGSMVYCVRTPSATSSSWSPPPFAAGTHTARTRLPQGSSESSLGAAGPVQINALNYAPVWLRSNGNLLVAQDGLSIVEYEPTTGNSVIISL